MTEFDKEAIRRIEEIEKNNAEPHEFKKLDYIIAGIVAVVGIALFIIGR
ncbi:MAG: hypothetical protein LBO63_07690 [Oscillospiraceae bacterium]|jgi:hypothetical protein|nr:hypothetical protein [Oscillospiraceae bacterium]